MNSILLNLSKRKKRDLLSELLSGKDAEGIVGKKELSALDNILESASSPAAVVARSSPAKKRVKKTPVTLKKQGKTKKKTTFYLSQEIVGKLDKAVKKIRTDGKEKYLSEISRSQIVDQALSLILEEFASQGKKSRLMRIIMQET
jgi:hypothetical protein